MRDRRPSALAVALFTCGISGVATSGCFLDNDVSDASCTPDDPDITLNDDCPYQQSRGPQIDNPKCETKFDSAQGPATWQEVFGIFLAPDKGNCSATACHGVEASAANGIYLPSDDEITFYENLTSTTGSVGKPYVNPDNPLDSWIHCNVAGRPGGGLIMPKPAGLPLKADAQTVEDWVHNNVPGPNQ
jgi:hypothetical protein